MGHKPYRGDTRRPTGDGNTATKASRIQPSRGSYLDGADKGTYSRIDVVRIGMEKLKSETRVNHHPFGTSFGMNLFALRLAKLP